MNKILSKLLIVIGSIIIIFYTILKYEVHDLQSTSKIINAVNSWEHPGLKIVGTIFKWEEIDTSLESIKMSRNQISDQIFLILIIGFITTISGITLHKKEKKKIITKK